MSTALTFQSTQFDVIDHNGQPWLRGPQIGEALNYRNPAKKIHELYTRHADEFTEQMTQVIEFTETPTLGGALITKARVFSLRGCHLLGMFARTPKAKEFRVWVLDVLDNLPQPTLDRLSHQSDPERKELTAMINAWVGVAPIHYAGARAIVNAHIGVKTVDEMTVTQVKQAIQFVMEKIKEAGQGALPATHDTFDLQVDSLVAGIQSTIRQLKRQTGELHHLCLTERKRSPHFRAHDKAGDINSRVWRTVDPLHYSLDYMLDAIEQNALLVKAAN